MQDEQRCADLLELGPRQASGAEDFRPGPHGKTAVKDQRIVAELRHDRGVARDVPTAHAHQSQPREKRASRPRQVAKPWKKLRADLQGRPAEYQPAGLGLAADGPQYGDQPAEAMPQHEYGFSLCSADDAIVVRVEIIDVLIERTHEASRTGGLAMPAEVHHRDRVATPSQTRRRSGVATSMLDKTMNQQHFGPRLTGGLPAAFEERQAVACRKRIFNQSWRHARTG